VKPSTFSTLEARGPSGIPQERLGILPFRRLKNKNHDFPPYPPFKGILFLSQAAGDLPFTPGRNDGKGKSALP
jgi:hypothetical protein